MIYKKCVMTIDKNKATLDEDIYLYRLDKNIELYFTIVNNKYRFNKGDMNNIILITNASFFQVRLYKNAEIKYTFAIQPTDGGQAILTITDDLIDDPIEVGDYDFQISLLDEEKTSMISMPIVSKQLHVCEPLVSDDATMGKAVLGLSKLATGEIKNAFDSKGNYIREIHKDGDILSASIINKFEDALDSNTKAIKAGTGKAYDDTAIKNDINTIKTDLGTAQLTTTAKDVKGAVNEVAAQYKDIAKKIENVGGFDTSKFMYVTKEVENVDVPCAGIALNTNTLTFTGSDTQTLTVTKTPSNTTDKVTYATNPTGIVVVNNGVVTPIKNGSTVITVTCGSKTATCDVTVTGISTTVAVQSVSLNKNTTTINVGETETLVATISPTNATNQNVTWGTDAPNIATVTNGVIEGKAVGTASISVETVDGSHTDTCNVTVKQGSASTGKNIFDKDTMIDTTKGISGSGEIITNSNWGLATVPVKANTNYSIKRLETVTAGSDNYFYNAVNVGAIGFANSNKTILSYLALDDNNIKNYLVTNSSGKIEWIKITTPANCSYLLFNTNLRTTADKIQVEEGDTIHNYYTAYEGGNN